MNINNNNRGNALFLILIAVALFAALSYAITQSGRGGGNVSKETAQLNVSQVAQQMGSYRDAIQRMKLINGCSDTQISFASSDWGHTAYNNSNSPTDETCHLFSNAGGGFTVAQLPDVLGTDIIFQGTAYVENVGTTVYGPDTDSTELLMIIYNVSYDHCLAFNQLMQLSSPEPEEEVLVAGIYEDEFAGNFINNQLFGPTYSGATNIDGMPAACVEAVVPGYANNYMIYYSLIER